MKIIEFDLGKILVVFDKFYSLSEVKNVAAVQGGSYAEEVTERIYQSLLGGTKNLREEYANYYAIEYDSFGKFLFWRYLVNAMDVSEIESQLTEETYVGFGKDGLYLFGDETVKSVLNHIFANLGEHVDENTN